MKASQSLAGTRRIPIVIAAVALMLFGGIGSSRAEWPTAGGDGGESVEVTTLADNGPGSLRAALSRGGERRIVFKVGGEILLKKPLVVLKPFVTIAGETAPSPGISILGDKLQIRTHDVIIRDIRIRVGERPGSNPSSRDGISIDLPPNKKPIGNILIDHCSVAWGIDENIGIWGKGVSNVLIRRTILAEALRSSIHPKTRHSMALLVGKGAENIVIERNLFAHNDYRNPLIDAGASAVVVNNVIYNPGKRGFHVYEKPEAGPTIVSVVGNLLIRGPDGKKPFPSFDKGVNVGSKIYYNDNQAIDAKAFSPSERAGGKEKSVAVPFVEAPPIWFDWIEVMPADAIEEAVLAEVGARPSERDETDQRIISEVIDRSGKVRDMPTDERLQVARPLPETQSTEDQ